MRGIPEEKGLSLRYTQRDSATAAKRERARERDPHCSELVPDRWGIVILTPPDHQPNVNKYEQQPGAIIYCSPLITSVALSLSQPLKSLSVLFYFELVRICDQKIIAKFIAQSLISVRSLNFLIVSFH